MQPLARVTLMGWLLAGLALTAGAARAAAEDEKKALDSKMAELKDAVKKAQLAARDHALAAALETVEKAEEDKWLDGG